MYSIPNCCEVAQDKTISRATRTLPHEVRRQAQQACRQFKANPWHGSLHFKHVHPREPIYSVRIARSYRALGKRDDKGMLWFWIGSHADYDRILGQKQK